MLDQLQESWNNLLEKLIGWFDALVVALPNIILAALVGGIAVFLSKYIRKSVERFLQKVTGNNTLVSVGSNFITAIFFLITLFLVLSILNLDKALTSLLAGAGVIGLAVGLALQDPMINLFSGVLMSVRDYYNIGDLIETNGYFGTIEKINLRSTVVLSPEGQEIIIPNKHVLQNPLVNFSNNGRRRIDISCGVAYGDDLKEVRSIAVKAIKEGVEYDKDRSVEFFFNEFGDSSINFTLRFWKKITGQAAYLAAQSEAIIALKTAFDEKGITIPFPIRTLDFGVVGGERLDELYPLKQMTAQANGQAQETE